MSFRPVLAAAALLALTACAPGSIPVASAPAPAPVPAPLPVAPPRAAAAVPAAERPSALPIFFEAWSANVGDEGMGALRELAERLRAAPRARLVIVGYASPRGTDAANQLLSQLRARRVYDALVELGVPAARLRRDSRGPTPGQEDLESRRVEVRLDQSANSVRR